MEQSVGIIKFSRQSFYFSLIQFQNLSLIILFENQHIILQSILLQISSHMDFELIFDKIGRFNYHNRFFVLFTTFTITLIFALGLINIRMQTDPQSLWVSQDSEGYKQEMDFSDRFGAFFRTEQLIVAQDQGRQDNIFKQKYLYSLYFVLNLINKKSVTVNNQDIKIQDLCYRPIKGKGCYRPSPLDLWKMDIADLQKDDQIQYTAMCIQSRSLKSRIPCSDQNQIPIIKESIFGGITCDQEKDKTSTIIIPCQHCWIQAKTLSATYLLNNDKFTAQAAEQWQKQVLIDTIHKYNADNGSFITEYKKYFPVTDDGYFHVQNGQPLNMEELMPRNLGIHIEFMSERSIPDELGNQTSENMWIVVISYCAMFFYIGIAIGQLPSKITSGFTLSIVGIIIVLASVVSSMGLISYMGVGFTMISGQVIPFLILAIGVDNMFIIKNSMERQTQYSKLQDKIAHGLRQVGPNITTAAICEALAFLVGSFTKMPALQNFCVQAAFAIIFNYIFQLTTFVVVLIMDEQRKKSGKLDVFCCIKGQQQPKQPKNFWMNVFQGPYYRLLTEKSCFFVVTGISILLLALAIVGAIFVPVGLNQQVSMQVQSDLFNYFTYEKKYIEIGPPSYIVLNGFDYQNKTHLQYIENMNSEVSKLTYINPPVYTWFASFNNFLSKGQSWSQICGSDKLDQYTYEQKLKKFLDISITSACCQSYGICGEQYFSDMQFDQETGKLVSSRLRVMHGPLRNSYDYIRSARQMRLAVQYIMKPLLEQDSNLQAYPYSLFYVYYDQYGYIRSVAIENLLLALAVVFLAVTIIKNIQIAITICAVVLLTTLDLIGFVYLTNVLFPDHGFIVQVNAISVVNLITCVGLSVQFSAHVCISMFAPSNLSGKDKLKDTLKNTVSSVFIGIGLTKFTGVLVLAFAKSTLFRLYYFRMYLGIVFLGLFNGLMVLPIVLYRLSPYMSGSYSKTVTKYFDTKGKTVLLQNETDQDMAKNE